MIVSNKTYTRRKKKKSNMSPKKGPYEKEVSFSNYEFSGDMLNFQGG